MNTITITPSSNAVLPFLKELLSNSMWVSKIVINEEKSDDFTRYNAETIQAIEDAVSGRNMTTYSDFDEYLKAMHANVEKASEYV
jgi:hypothetical protein